MGTTKAWRRDAWRWSLKYGAIAAGAVFLYIRRAYPDPASSWLTSVWHDVLEGLAYGVLAAVIIFVVRWRGSLVDLDELQAVGRGGLGLGRPKPRLAPNAPESHSDDSPSPGAA